MNQPDLIGLYSPVMQSGKTAVADYLRTKHGYVVVKFATPLKAMLTTFFEHLGYGNSSAQMLEGSLKEVPIPELDNITARRLMQTLGTDWGRCQVALDVWVTVTRRRCQDLLNTGHKVVVEDVRLPNEHQMCSTLGKQSQLWKIHRAQSATHDVHSCEGRLNNYPFQVHICNDSSLADLYRAVDGALNLNPMRTI